MIVKDWVQEAADEIIGDHEPEPYKGYYRSIIVRHCPFEPGVAYMPVPRCDQCKHWLPRATTLQGSCLKTYDEPSKMWSSMYDDVITEPDFGCVQWEAK